MRWRPHRSILVLALATACGNGARTVPADIVADAHQLGTPMTADQLGSNLALYFPESAQPALQQRLKRAGVRLLRWPGGSLADSYHWKTNVYVVPQDKTCRPVHEPADREFDTFMQRMVEPGGFDLNITVNYGSNEGCTAGGSAAEAAQWVRESNVVHHYGVKYWTVGNEQYFNSRNPTTVDLNSPPHDAGTYASRVANEFYPQMKGVDPTIAIGVDVVAGTQNGENIVPNWDDVVLKNAKYDFVELHYYPDIYDDDRMLRTAPNALASHFATLKKELAAAHRAETPIYLGEFDVDTTASKQSVSIVDALFVGMAIGEATKVGVRMTSVYEGIGDCPPSNDRGASAYGWQNFGSFGMFSTAEEYNKCPVPRFTAFPKARAIELAHLYVVPGERPLATKSNAPAVRAYGATHGNGGYAFMLFNLDRDNGARASVSVENVKTKAFTAVVATYGKAQYDLSRDGKWDGPVSRDIGSVGNPVTVELPPWSMTVLTLTPR